MEGIFHRKKMNQSYFAISHAQHLKTRLYSWHRKSFSWPTKIHPHTFTYTHTHTHSLTHTPTHIHLHTHEHIDRHVPEISYCQSSCMSTHIQKRNFEIKFHCSNRIRTQNELFQNMFKLLIWIYSLYIWIRHEWQRSNLN